MKLIYNETLTKNIVENYFRTYEDIDAELEIKCGVKNVSSIGRSIVYHQFPTITFTLRGSMETEGEMQQVEIELSEQDVENAFTTMIEASGRKVKSVSICFDEKEFKSVNVEAVAKRKVKR